MLSTVQDRPLTIAALFANGRTIHGSSEVVTCEGERGPIKTKFGDTAIESVRGLGASGSPCAAFNAILAQKIDDAYDGPLRGGPRSGRVRDRARDDGRAAADALPGHVRGALPDGPAALAPRPGLRRL